MEDTKTPYNVNEPMLIMFITLGKGTPLRPKEDNVSNLLAYRSFTITKVIRDLDIRKEQMHKLVPLLSCLSPAVNKNAYDASLTTIMADAAGGKEVIDKMPTRIAEWCFAGQMKFVAGVESSGANVGMRESIVEQAKELLKDSNMSDSSREAVENMLKQMK